jgi:DNA polymerase-3 subunit beta
MRFKVSAGALRDALNQARHATPASPSMIAFGGVLVLVDEVNSELSVTGSDGETTITATCKVSDTSSGQVLLPPKPVAAFLSTLDGKSSVTVETGADGDVLIGAGGEPYRFRPLAATFPTPTKSDDNPQEANLIRLHDALSAVRHATSKESPGVQVVSTATSLVLHATDNYRLARAEISDGGFGEFVGLLPLAVLDRVSRLSPNAVSWDSRTRTVVFHCPGVKISTRLMATAFPAVETVLSSVPQVRANFDAPETLAALSRLAAVADQAPVAIRLSDTTMELRVFNADLGSGYERVELQDRVEVPVELHVRLSYLVDALASCGEKMAAFAYTGAHQPLFVLATDPVTTIQVVMPVRV